ncbi:hypothetical protein FRC20_004474 [Serendipita sp. 405]|nr:hypothetical protein FRC20_004474 [Serendipita sp. 405]
MPPIPSLSTKRDDTPKPLHRPQCPCPCHQRVVDENTQRSSSPPIPTTTTQNTFTPGDGNPTTTTLNLSPCHSSGNVRLPTGGLPFMLEPLFEQVVVRFSLGETNVDGRSNRNDGGGGGGRRQPPITSPQAPDRRSRSSTDGPPSSQSGPGPSIMTTREAASTGASTRSTLVGRTRTVNRRSDPYKGPARQRRASRSETKPDH